MNEDNQDIESNEGNQDRKINIINHQENGHLNWNIY